MTDKIQVIINGQNHLLEDPISLETLLQNLKIDPRYIAIALNEEIVAHSQNREKYVKNGDRIEIIRAVAGG